MIVASSSNRTFWRSALCACENPSCLLYCKMLFPTSQSVFLLMQHLSQGTCLFSCHIFWKKNEGNLFLALLARYGVVFLCLLPLSSIFVTLIRDLSAPLFEFHTKELQMPPNSPASSNAWIFSVVPSNLSCVNRGSCSSCSIATLRAFSTSTCRQTVLQMTKTQRFIWSKKIVAKIC